MKQIHIEPTVIQGCYVVRGMRHQDHRGSFQELYNKSVFEGVRELPHEFVQTNLSVSTEGVIRGLHFQTKEAQGKLVHCLWGAIMDVCVDVRKGSPTYGRVARAMLTANNLTALYCPPGTAHGFEVIRGHATVLYHCTSVYKGEYDSGIRWDDRTLGIPWQTEKPILSAKDSELQTFLEYDARPE